MSRIGKLPVKVPQGVEVTLNGQDISAKGKLGQLSLRLVDDIAAEMKDGTVVLTRRTRSKLAESMWATSRTLVNNIVNGVNEGFTINLEITGVGYRAALQGNALVLSLGYSHEVRLDVPQGITVKCEKPTSIALHGADKQKLGQFAANIRAYRPPEPYKGKGIKYEGEYILRKEGKKK